MQIDIHIPPVYLPLYKTDKRFIVLKGGRGSGKSHTVATFLLTKGIQEPKRILCTREFQSSIKDSVHKLLADKIQQHGLDFHYTIKNDSIVGNNGSLFIFKGLSRDPDGVKSAEGLDYAWVEEAHSVSRKSLEILTPTVRKDGSQIIYTYNPTNEDDPVLIDYPESRDDVLTITANYDSNPYFPDVLRSEMEHVKKTDEEKYRHIWLGETIKHADAQVLYGKWTVQEFEAPGNTQFYFGADWGYAQDPTCLVRSFILKNTLYIDYEAWGIGVDLDDVPELFRTVPLADKMPIRGDSSRPDTIAYLNKQGFNIVPSRKGKNSIIDGIQKIRGFDKVVIHPRCRHTIDEFRNYVWKVNERTGEYGNVPVDKSNHIIDSLRYSLELVNDYATILYG